MLQEEDEIQQWLTLKAPRDSSALDAALGSDNLPILQTALGHMRDGEFLEKREDSVYSSRLIFDTMPLKAQLIENIKICYLIYTPFHFDLGCHST